MFLLLLPYAVQILFIIHAIRNGKNTTWIWLLIMLPLVGGLIYFFMEIVPDLRRGRLIDPEALVGLVDKQASVKRIQEKLLVADTVANHLELADEYYRIGAHAQALAEYRSQLAGVYLTDRSIRLGAAKAAFRAGDHAAAAEYFALADGQAKITSTEHKLYWSFSAFRISPSDETLGALDALFRISRSGEVGYHLCLALADRGQKEKVPEVLAVMRVVAKNARGALRSQNQALVRKVEKEILGV